MAVLSLLAVASASAQKLKEQHAWYHTSDEIRAEMAVLSSTCSGAKLSLSTRTYELEANQPSVELDVVRISDGSSMRSKQKAFFVFGEHARELISPESALQLLRLLCGGGDSSDSELVQQALQHTTFVVVPNANPLGRKQVEMGQYCKRTNEDGVDLNRNWAFSGAQHKSTSALGLDEEVNPGPNAFSEPETRILRSILEEEKPDIFLSVHSGAYLLGMPPPSSSGASKAAQNQQQITDLLGGISQQFCDGDCPFGDLTDVIGYRSQGCDIDYVKQQMQTPYAFTWEIYANPDIRKFFAEKAHARAEGREMEGAAKAYFSMKSLMFLETHRRGNVGRRLRGPPKLASSEDYENDECFQEFNPISQAETEKVVSIWARAFITLCTEVHDMR